ncbi:hypothetical protein PoB_006363700 [Plakobranchus ocellatus]|uniref:Uncharacterized protein n=1 Tax=Plakobranchus ocellatus TaxID=259542 RepID=A0AAV4CYV5_9GAST|nr:hypothetical protein PoB_006363700 [Plakobranchus ocellatus]
MANYLSLWTSSKDPEFQQIKKTKQLTERRLAMHVSGLEKDYKRHIRKSNNEIRESITMLEQLERDKEARARHILATYLKMQKRKAAASAWTQKYFKSLAQKRKTSDSKVHAQEEESGSLVDIVTTRGTVSLRDFSTSKAKDRIAFPKIHRLEAVKENDSDEKADAILSVARANSTDNMKLGDSGREDRAKGCKEKSYPDSSQAESKAEPKSSIEEPLYSSRLPNGRGSNVDAMKKQLRLRDVTRNSPGRRNSHGQATWRRKRYSLRGDVYVTFPFVYHSQGEITCPRYSLFRECTDYDPYTENKTGNQGKMSTSSSQRTSVGSLKSILSKPGSRRESQLTVGGDSVPSVSRRGSKRVSFSNVALAVQAIQSIQN